MVKTRNVLATGPWHDKAYYDYTRSLPRIGWAWEYVRRNPELRKLQYEVVPHRENGSSLLRTVNLPRPSPDLEKWGLLFFDDFEKTAHEALVFWRREICPFVASVWAFEVDAEVEAARFSLSHLNCEGCMLHTDGADHVLLKKAGRTVQLIWNGADIVNDGLVLTVPIELFERMTDGERLATRRLLDIQRYGRIRARLFKPDPRNVKLRMCLQALDGRLAGASWRQVAGAVFGEQWEMEERGGQSRSLLDRTRRHFSRGLAYMKGQYREFLK